MAVKRKKSTSSQQPRSRSQVLRDRLVVGFSIALIALALTTLVLTFYQRFTFTGPYLMEYEGRVIDKSVTWRETDIGSIPVRRLHIRGRGGEEFPIIVNESLYERAQVGMWIKSSAAGTEVSWEQP